MLTGTLGLVQGLFDRYDADASGSLTYSQFAHGLYAEDAQASLSCDPPPSRYPASAYNLGLYADDARAQTKTDNYTLSRRTDLPRHTPPPLLASGARAKPHHHWRGQPFIAVFFEPRAAGHRA